MTPRLVPPLPSKPALVVISAAVLGLLAAGHAARLAESARTAGSIIAEICTSDAGMLSSNATANPRSARPTTTVQPLMCERLPNAPGKSMTTALVTFPPNAYTPAHRHPGSVTAFVVKGTLRSQMAGGPAQSYVAGNTWFEAPGALHMMAENPSQTETAVLLATFVADDDCGPLTIPEPTASRP